MSRPGLPGHWPAGYDGAGTPFTPAWQAEITGVPAEAAIRVARELGAGIELARLGPPTESIPATPPVARSRRPLMEVCSGGVLPDLAFLILIGGLIRRDRFDQFDWTTRSSQLYESGLLRIGSPVFHFGIRRCCSDTHHGSDILRPNV